jgi:hypothetical protein
VPHESNLTDWEEELTQPMKARHMRQPHWAGTAPLLFGLIGAALGAGGAVWGSLEGARSAQTVSQSQFLNSQRQGAYAAFLSNSEDTQVDAEDILVVLHNHPNALAPMTLTKLKADVNNYIFESDRLFEAENLVAVIGSQGATNNTESERAAQTDALPIAESMLTTLNGDPVDANMLREEAAQLAPIANKRLYAVSGFIIAARADLNKPA